MKKAMAALFAAGACAALAGIDMRIPSDAFFSVAVDLDAIRAETPAVVKAVRDGIAAGRDEGSIPKAKAARACDVIDRTESWFRDAGEACGLGAGDFHWVVAEATNCVFWARRDYAVTQLVWSATAAVDGCDWDRIESYCKSKGAMWHSGTLFGVRSHRLAWYTTDGFQGISLMITPDGDKTHLGLATSRMWEAVRGMLKLDERPSRRRSLEHGEVVRLVLTDPKQVMHYADISRGLPENIMTLLDGLSELRISIFLADGKVGASLAAKFADGATAASALKLYEDECGASERKRLEDSLARAREKGDREDIQMYEATIAFMDGLRARVDGSELLLDTGRGDVRRFFAFVALPLAEAAEVLGSIF